MKKLAILILSFFLIQGVEAQTNKETLSRKKARLTRGPYLQMVGAQTVTFRWRTKSLSDSKVSVGTALKQYPLTIVDSQLTTEHIVTISGLAPDTKYFYEIGSTDKKLQGDKQNFFITAPADTTKRKVRIAAFGDCGRNWFGFQTMVLDGYQKYTRKNPAEVLLLLGDNAYNHGTDKEYQNKFFERYGSTILKNHALFPTPGNHDYGPGPSTSRDFAYYHNFTVPTKGELGGVPSGTESFYSYNWGNIHFISMDSYATEDNGTTRLYDTLGAQVSWVKKDLAANQQKWTVVYWHHPPYSMGSHNSDREDELVQIRSNFLRILERYGVDLVLCGHSHDYERSYLLRGHFGMEASFDTSQHAVSTSSAKYNSGDNACPYITSSGQNNHGTVYVVAGSSGAKGRIQKGYPHNALPFAHNKGGMLLLEVEDNRLDGKFVGRFGKVRDQFTIVKDVKKTSDVRVKAGTAVTLTASWVGNYKWSTGETSRSITVTPNSNVAYTVGDGSDCLSETFVITVER